MGIDMSRAFDTIKRAKILEIFDIAGCNEDELRLTQALLANTQLTVRIKNTHSASFETTIGSPQGDSLSPVFSPVTLKLPCMKLDQTPLGEPSYH